MVGLPATMLAHEFDLGVILVVKELRWLVLYTLWVMLMECVCDFGLISDLVVL